MLGQTEEAVRAALGRPLATANARHLADRAFHFLTDSMKVEVGFRNKLACYIIYRKRSGGQLQPLEVQSLLYGVAQSADWEPQPIEPKPRTTRSSRSTRTSSTRGSEVSDFVYKERETKSASIKRVLFAQVQASRTQLVVFAADWMPDLAAVERNPLR